jgi:LysM repeat protein
MKIKLPNRKPAPPQNRPPKLKLKASIASRRRSPVAPVIEEENEDFIEESEPNMKLSHAFVVVLVLHVIAVAGVLAFNSIKARQAAVFSAMKDAPAKVASTGASAATADPATANASAPDTGSGSSGGDMADPSNGGSAPAPQNVPSAPVAPSASATPEPAASQSVAGSGTTTHQVQPGETLVKIASDYGVSVAELEKANSITDPKKIQIGTTLTIPAGASAPAKATTPAAAAPAAAEAAAASPAESSVADSGKVYTVAKGDSPWKIAKKLKVPYADLLSLNGITDPRKLQIGQKLKVPAKTTVSKKK